GISRGRLDPCARPPPRDPGRARARGAAATIDVLRDRSLWPGRLSGADGDLRGDCGSGEVEDRRRRERGTLGPEGPRALRDHCVSRPASVPAARALGYWRQVTPLATW